MGPAPFPYNGLFAYTSGARAPADAREKGIMAKSSGIDALLEALYAAFGRDGVAVRGSHTGLHLLAAVHNGMTERELVEAAARAGVHVNGLSAYYMEHPEDCPPATVVLGYSDMDERALRAAVDALRCAWGARPSE